MDNLDYTIKDKLLRSQLVNIRKSKHLTQKQISEISGLSTSCISNIESSDLTSPTVRSLLRYADALGVDLYIGIYQKQRIKLVLHIYKSNDINLMDL